MKRRDLMQATMAAGLIAGTPRLLAAAMGGGASAPRRRGLATGIGDLDALLGGLRPGEVVVLAGSASAGKTCLAAQVAAHAAAGLGAATVYLAYDNDVADIRLLMTCQLACVDRVRARIEPYTDDEARRMAHAEALLAAAPLDVRSWDDADPAAFAALVRGLARERGTRFLVVDSHPGLAGGEPRHAERGAAFGRVLRDLAVELGLAILAVTQARVGDDDAEALPAAAGRVVTLRRAGAPSEDGFEEREVSVPGTGRARLGYWRWAGRYWSRCVGAAAREALCGEGRLVCAG
jgi:replicative DNA helicase